MFWFSFFQILLLFYGHWNFNFEDLGSPILGLRIVNPRFGILGLRIFSPRTKDPQA